MGLAFSVPTRPQKMVGEMAWLVNQLTVCGVCFHGENVLVLPGFLWVNKEAKKQSPHPALSRKRARDLNKPF